MDPTPESEAEINSYRGYENLMVGLAQRGFLAVSINANDLSCNPAGNRFMDEGRNLFLEHIAYLSDLNAGSATVDPFGGRTLGRLDLDSIILGGHSRGADRATLTASNPGPIGTLRGVVAVASPWDAYRSELLLPSVPVQMIYGTKDGDVVPVNPDGSLPSDGGPIRLFDRMTVAGLASLHLIDGANHNQFNTIWETQSEPNEPGSSGDRIDDVLQRRILRDYAVAFAEAMVHQSGRGHSVISGDLPIGTSSNGSYHQWVRTAYREANQFNIDHFDNGDETLATYDSSPVEILNGSPSEESLRTQEATNSTVHHDTDGLYSDDPGPLEMEWDLTTSPVDVREYTHLSVRVARTANASNPQPSNGLVAQCRFEDPTYATTYQTFTSANRARRPNVDDDWNLSFLETIRFPMACLAPGESGLNQSAIARIGLEIQATTGAAAMLVDDLAFQGADQ